MTVEENLQKVDPMIEAFNDHDLDRFVGFRAESNVYHAPELPEPLKGRGALREFYQGLLKAFPDGRAEVVRAFGQGDWVSLELTVTGTHQGPLPGPGGEAIPATNKPVRFKTCFVVKFEGGEVTEEHEYWDQLGFMAQLGLAP
ncbi:MAG: ester cyclase [Candidatus Thermoplasmatota archaeon]|nr:ester cyclase [Candidatus Thermoplasmatota archaeon]